MKIVKYRNINRGINQLPFFGCFNMFHVREQRFEIRFKIVVRMQYRIFKCNAAFVLLIKHIERLYRREQRMEIIAPWISVISEYFSEAEGWALIEKYKN